jgi:hypothetical protein
MRRLVWPGVAWLLVAVSPPLAAQRAGDPPAPRLEEPRPFPAFPVALVPFIIPAEWCRGGGRPSVSLHVHNSTLERVRTLRIRGQGGQSLDGLTLRCGTHVAIWDGTIDDPPRLPFGAVYHLRLVVERPGFRSQPAQIRSIAIQG